MVRQLSREELQQQRQRLQALPQALPLLVVVVVVVVVAKERRPVGAPGGMAAAGTWASELPCVQPHTVTVQRC